MIDITIESGWWLTHLKDMSQLGFQTTNQQFLCIMIYLIEVYNRNIPW